MERWTAVSVSSKKITIPPACLLLLFATAFAVAVPFWPVDNVFYLGAKWTNASVEIAYVVAVLVTIGTAKLRGSGRYMKELVWFCGLLFGAAAFMVAFSPPAERLIFTPHFLSEYGSLQLALLTFVSGAVVMVFLAIRIGSDTGLDGGFRGSSSVQVADRNATSSSSVLQDDVDPGNPWGHTTDDSTLSLVGGLAATGTDDPWALPEVPD